MTDAEFLEALLVAAVAAMTGPFASYQRQSVRMNYQDLARFDKLVYGERASQRPGFAGLTDIPPGPLANDIRFHMFRATRDVARRLTK